MKQYSIFASGLLVVVLMLNCFSGEKTLPQNVQKNSTPSVIELKYLALNISLDATLDANSWKVSIPAANTYLTQVATKIGKTGLGSFTDISVEFDSTYTKGVLEGTALDEKGNKVPIGVEYVFSSNSGSRMIMHSANTHTCTGAPCSCCSFIRKSVTIIGCTCDGSNPCQGSKCNHTVTGN